MRSAFVPANSFTLTWRMKCVDDFDRLFEFDQLFFDLFLCGSINDEHVDEVIRQQLTRVANINGGFCNEKYVCVNIVNIREAYFAVATPSSHLVYHR